MLNYLWLGLILSAILLGGATGHIREVSDGAIKAAETSVTIALGLIGVMTLWLGMMRLAEKSGLVLVFARWLRPALRRLFPDVPVDHPAMGSMVMNIAANMLGLVNAATPLGLRAMKDLESLNPHPGRATNAMCTFLAINTGSVQLIPVTAIAVLVGAGSKNPSAIVGTALLATLCSSIAGLVTVKVLEKSPWFSNSPAADGADIRPIKPEDKTAPPAFVAPSARPQAPVILLLFGVFFLFCLSSTAFPEWFGGQGDAQAQSAGIRIVNALSLLAIPFLIAFFPLYAALRRLEVYDEFIEGAREGFQVAIRIIPYLLAMLVAIGMFRAAGAIDLLTRWSRPILDVIGFPPELLTLALMRPLSGSGSLAIFTELVKQYGPDHLLVRMAGTLFGSTETTFYVVAVYFGAVAVTRTRQAIPAGLAADIVGALAAVYICRWVF
jgi:spore maturation protein SpmA